MQTIRCSGVAEHFNYPWMLGLERNQFSEAGIQLKWEDSAGGTGAMCKDLRNEEIDLAVMLTEGALVDIVNGNPSRIISSYVNSPLIWGVHTSSKSNISLSNQKDFPFVISRYNSGSHLMAQLYAKDINFALEDLLFNEIGGLNNAISELEKNPDQLFLWEKYTTKPFVDQGKLKLVGECPTPWPSFIIVVREEYLKSNFNTVKKVLEIVEQNTQELKSLAETPLIISKKYGIKYVDAVSWFNALDWRPNSEPSSEMLSSVSKKLVELKILDRGLNPYEVNEKLLFNKPSTTGMLH